MCETDLERLPTNSFIRKTQNELLRHIELLVDYPVFAFY